MLYREIILSAVILAGLSVPDAKAQERWAGAYAGIALSAQDASSAVQGNGVHRYSEDSASLGFYGGYTFVRDSGFAWGPDVLLTGLGSSGQRTDAPLGTTKVEGSFLLSPRMRAGYATERAYFYGVLGLGISDLGVQSVGNDDTDITIGGAIGVGMEVATGARWSARVEAMSYDFSADDRTVNGLKRNLRGDVQQITFGMSRKF